MSSLIRLSKPSVGTEEVEAFTRVLEAGYLGMSTEVQAFETELKAFLSPTAHEVVCVNTGTSALHLALQACGVGPGDEVIVPTLTYVASFQAIHATGAVAVACDVDSETGFMSPKDAEARITNRTKAIMPVHYASYFDDIAPIYDLAKNYNLRVIEDAAHSFGGCDSEGNLAGAMGDIICFSFDSIKNITCGEGGAIVTADPKILEHVRDARLLSVEKDTEMRFSKQRSWQFDVKTQGWRYHMSDIMACIGRTQLKKLSSFVTKRREGAQAYQKAFKDHSIVRTFDFDYTRLAPHIFPIFLRQGDRDNLRSYLLEEHAIQTGLHYYLNHWLTYFKTPYRLPAAENLYASMLSLPLHPDMNTEAYDRVIRAVMAWCEL